MWDLDEGKLINRQTGEVWRLAPGGEEWSEIRRPEPFDLTAWEKSKRAGE